MYKVVTEPKGKKTIILDIINKATGEIYEPKFLDYTCPEDYLNDNVIGVEPMTAKEPLNDEELEKMLTSSDYIAEEKLDGTRCTMHLLEGAIDYLVEEYLRRQIGMLKILIVYLI